ncbi:BMC domain-containing protein [Photobacterium kasasachensis]|uniref:BMC domain-containing protein n=1 Tax=Photobacterium kasasachensis TaxID=2910240 RepID=UPI003D13420B
MRLQTIGCVELNSVAVGIQVADAMIKAASVELVMAKTTCPGRYLIVIAGDTSAVTSSVESGCMIGSSMVVDRFIIPRVHHSVASALQGVPEANDMAALGVIEVYTCAGCILAADAAAKAANVQVLDIRFAAGLAGKAFVILSGDVSSVQAAVEAGVTGVGESGPVLSHVVIPAPSQELHKYIV